MPAFGGGQLLRRLTQLLEERGYFLKCPNRVMAAAVTGGDDEAGLAGMAGLAGDAMEEERTGGQSFAMVVGIGQPREQGPPVVDKGDQTGHDLAPCEVCRGETGPSPMIFQFIKWIFDIPFGMPLIK